MSRPIKLPLESLQDVKKHKIVSICTAAAAGIIILLLVIVSAVKLSSQEHVWDADLVNAARIGEETITINPNPFCRVSVFADGENHVVRARGSVADALEAAGIDVGDDDLINVGLAEPLNANTNIIINRVEYVTEVKLETIDYATEYKEDDSYVIGYSKVLVDGEEGELAKTICHTYVDGKLASSDVVSTEITEEPVDEVIVTGTAEVNPIAAMSISQLDVPDDLALDENGVPTSYSQVLTGKSCAYSARPTAKTASGRQVKVGYVAVDPSIIPYGTELYIVSTDGKYVYGYAVAADTGTALLDGRILVDLFMESYEASCEWGAKQVNIYVL
ncbi:MAG: G5 domain-containing protein [Oscillospiraceae bacterium]